MPAWSLFAAFLSGAVLAVLLFWLVFARRMDSRRRSADSYASDTLRQAELDAAQIRATAELETEKARALREADLQKREQQVEATEQLLRDRQEHLRDSERMVQDERKSLQERRDEVECKKREAERSARLYRMRLHSMVNWDQERAHRAALDDARKQLDREVRQLRNQILSRTEVEVEEHAKRILLAAMQRITSNPANETSATVVRLKNEEMKGRIIGREGRNIRCFEAVTGTTLMIDESPESVLISSFDPVRREIARLALDALMADGRINPGSIEETVRQCQANMDRSILEWGEGALRKLNLHSVSPEIIPRLGRLHYHLSNNQNTLDHSIEVAFISSILASELNLDPSLAKRAGLFHDMGKAMGHEHEGSHAAVAADVLKRSAEDPRVVNAVAAHHEEIPDESLYAPLLKIADSLSAMRPGARTDSMESYLRRVKSLEEIALAFKGVQEAYAIQAGREVRVIVAPELIDDEGARDLARSIRIRIEDELSFPGSIKITVIREQRFNETAK